MSFLTRWFRKSDSEDYAQVLEALALDIQKRQTRLSELRLRERRATLLVSTYALLLWLAYGGLWYMEVLPNISGHRSNGKFERTVKAVPVFLGPIVILFIRRIVQIWYTRKGDTEEKSLVKLRKEQREKIEEIKKKTNYYSTRNLIERYDDGPANTIPNTPQPGQLRRRLPPQGPPSGSAPATPRHPLSPNSQMPSPQQGSPQLPPNLQQHLSPIPQAPMPPPRKQWYDKLADAILGDDDVASTSAAASRYALICQKCFAHNGLVKESMFEDAQYVCPKCGHFNPSIRAIRNARAASKSVSPDGMRIPVPEPMQPDHAPENVPPEHQEHGQKADEDHKARRDYSLSRPSC
ncbi:hypothetical protein CERSUDRAFT_66753 [Gelatoporia subvermispora B]|uniref:Endoplasmic reticulum junction formation protein lunapark n=1 Tax=Ceriporiopsis subvermispora (strain B) TaxID=914234 RepID=M2QF54_CERS8|nr:hypothetical protein CERSUDRAFT_66753 [Gelatoporia subvermispora B]